MLSIGCHVSIAGGIWNAPKNAAALGCETFQIFTRSPQGGPAPALGRETVEEFLAAMNRCQLKEFVVHAPYIINFGSADPRVYHGSIQIVRQDLERASLLGAKYVMFHPGSIKDNLAKGIKQVKEGFKKILDGYKDSAKLLIENTAGAGEVVGDTFEELAELIRPLLNHPGFGGICFDTQHAFGSGYDLRTKETVAKTFKEFDKLIGLKWLKCVQVNDSKVNLGSHKDRHEHIGDGQIGEKGFGALLDFLNKGLKMKDHPHLLPLAKGEREGVLALILETKADKVEADIKILKKLRDKS